MSDKKLTIEDLKKVAEILEENKEDTLFHYPSEQYDFRVAKPLENIVAVKSDENICYYALGNGAFKVVEDIKKEIPEPVLKKSKYFICMDVGLTGFFSIIQYEKNKVNKYFKVIHSEALQVELKEDFLFKTDESKQSKVMVKNQISFNKNYSRIKELMAQYGINPEDCLAFTEQLTPRPIHSRVSILSLGDTNGVCRAICEVLGIKYIVIPPKTWKDGINVTSEKETSIDYFHKNIVLEDNVKDMFGILPVGAKQKNGKPKKQKTLNHNQVESVLIAHWYYLTQI